MYKCPPFTEFAKDPHVPEALALLHIETSPRGYPFTTNAGPKLNVLHLVSNHGGTLLKGIPFAIAYRSAWLSLTYLYDRLSMRHVSSPVVKIDFLKFNDSCILFGSTFVIPRGKATPRRALGIP